VELQYLYKLAVAGGTLTSSQKATDESRRLSGLDDPRSVSEKGKMDPTPPLPFQRITTFLSQGIMRVLPSF
jgi:hypothetical protein